MGLHKKVSIRFTMTAVFLWWKIETMCTPVENWLVQVWNTLLVILRCHVQTGRCHDSDYFLGVTVFFWWVKAWPDLPCIQAAALYMREGMIHNRIRCCYKREQDWVLCCLHNNLSVTELYCICVCADWTCSIVNICWLNLWICNTYLFSTCCDDGVGFVKFSTYVINFVH